MRVILKPAGVGIILAAFAALIWIVVSQSQLLQSHALPSGGAAAAPADPNAPPSSFIVKPELVNTGFEDDYRAALDYGHKAKLSGKIAYPWRDDSSWAPVSVSYERDTANPHSGAASQKVVVSAVPSNVEARVQFVQAAALPVGKKYRATCWMRADHPVVIDISLRQELWPYRYYGVHDVEVGTEWKQYEVTGEVNSDGKSNPGNTFLMLKVSKPVTFWVDDASIRPE